MKRLALVLFVGLDSAGCSGYHGTVQCVPYARRVSGLDLYGSAASWWQQARGRYRQSYWPVEGAVLVFRSSSYIPEGHVAIVRNILTSRLITVDQANWVAGKTEHGVMVQDVSTIQNWSRVRVWWSPMGRWGQRIYPTYGFLFSKK